MEVMIDFLRFKLLISLSLSLNKPGDNDFIIIT